MRTMLKRYVPNFDDTEQRLAYKIACYLSTGLSQGKTTYISAGETKQGNFAIIHAFEDCVFSAITFAPGSTEGTFVGRTLLAGDRAYLQATSLTLASGFAALSWTSQPFSANRLTANRSSRCSISLR